MTEATTITKKYAEEVSTGVTSQLELDKLKGLRLASLVRWCFFPTKRAAAYDATSLLSLADAPLLAVSSSESDIVMVNFFLEGSTLRLACLQGKAEMATAKSNPSNYCTLC